MTEELDAQIDFLIDKEGVPWVAGILLDDEEIQGSFPIITELGCLARNLSPPDEAIKIKEDLESGAITVESALVKILEHWRARNGDEATFQNLCKMLNSGELKHFCVTEDNEVNTSPRTRESESTDELLGETGIPMTPHCHVISPSETNVPGDENKGGNDDEDDRRMEVDDHVETCDNSSPQLIIVDQNPPVMAIASSSNDNSRCQIETSGVPVMDNTLNINQASPSSSNVTGKILRSRFNNSTGCMDVVRKVSSDLEHGKLAVLLLNISAYLNQENIQWDFFYQLPANILTTSTPLSFFKTKRISKVKVDAGINLLLKNSVITAEDSQTKLNVPASLQESTRGVLANDGKEKHILEVILQLISVKKEEEYPEEDIDHFVSVWKYARNHPKLIKSYSKRVCFIVKKLGSIGRYNNGIEFGKDVSDKFKEVLGEDHLNYIELQMNIGVIYNLKGDFQESAKLLEALSEKAEPLLGGANNGCELFLKIKDEHAQALFFLGHYDKALGIQKVSMEKAKEIFGNNHECTLMAEHNYAMTLIKKGEVKRAMKIMRDLVKRKTSIHGKNHDCVLQARLNLALIYSSNGIPNQALPIFEDVYRKTSAKWTENMDLFTTACHNLAEARMEGEKYEEAVQLLEENVEKLKSFYGEDHYKFLFTLQIQGAAYRGNKETNKALEVHKRAHEGFVTAYGEGSKDALAAEDEIAVDLSILGQHEDSLLLFRGIIEKYNTLEEKNKEMLTELKINYADALERGGYLQEALEILREVKKDLPSAEVKDRLKIIKVSERIRRVEGKINNA